MMNQDVENMTDFERNAAVVERWAKTGANFFGSVFAVALVCYAFFFTMVHIADKNRQIKELKAQIEMLQRPEQVVSDDMISGFPVLR